MLVVFRTLYLDRPDVPLNFTSVNTQHNTVNLTWISSFNGGSIQTFTIEQKQTNTGNEWQNTAANIPDIGQKKVLFHVVECLKAQTSYQFKLYSRNSFGSSD